MRAKWKSIIIRTFLLGLITIIGIVSAVLISIRCHQGFEPAIADCPITWSTYSLGTNHNLIFVNNRPVTGSKTTRYLMWLNAVSFGFNCYDVLDQTLIPTLLVHVGLPNQPSPIGGRAVLVLRNGRRNEGGGGREGRYKTGRYRSYTFDEFPQDLHGGVVEFYLPDQTNVIGRLKL